MLITTPWGTLHSPGGLDGPTVSSGCTAGARPRAVAQLWVQCWSAESRAIKVGSKGFKGVQRLEISA